MCILKKKLLSPLVFILCFQLAFLCGQSRAGAFGLSDEKELGRKFGILVKSRMPIVPDPEIKNYVTGITFRLLKNIPPQPYDFDINVLRSDTINAFASPGGHLFVFTGLIMSMHHEGEVASIMAHELAHATQRHIATRIERSQIIGIAALLLSIAGIFLGKDTRGAGAIAPMAAAQAAMLNYSREDESEADQMGLSYLIKAGYNPKYMVSAFEIIRNETRRTSSDIPTYMATHPNIQARITDITARIARLPARALAQKENDTTFIRIKTLIRAKYSDPEPALRFFASDNTAPKYLTKMGEGIVYSRLNKITDATRCFDEALKLGPHEELVWREAGIFQYKKGGANSSEKATQLLARAVQMKPSDYLAAFYNALILGERGNFAEAESQFKTVLKYLPEDSEVRFMYARLLGSNGKNFEAYLQLAYSALYENKGPKAKANREKAAKCALAPEQKSELKRFDGRYKEREEFW